LVAAHSAQHNCKAKRAFMHHHTIDREQRARIELINNTYINWITATVMLTLLAVQGIKTNHPS